MSNHDTKHKGLAKKAIMAFLGLFFLAAMLQWSWNSFVVEVLGFQQINFKNALAIEFLLLSMTGVFAMAWRFLLTGHNLTAEK
ncbi:hypothetical protein [Hahella ganghwensis]|uniref:hypothetical protein n=1 Tax=Hahella ganghwensis TaxID=286420 RepID=UPI0003697505|nr:hypothetical protein [Hahella ganghwensis]